jgi:hypothetical protein
VFWSALRLLHMRRVSAQSENAIAVGIELRKRSRQRLVVRRFRFFQYRNDLFFGKLLPFMVCSSLGADSTVSD